MKQLWKKQASLAYGFSLTRLALDYYCFRDELAEKPLGERAADYGVQFSQALSSYLDGGDSLDVIIPLRKKLQQEMEIIIAYTDCFRIYEYALNRMERRFETDLQPMDCSEAEFVNRLMNFVANAKDSAVVNQRVQMIIGQLPVRFTRQKFYSMVQAALSIYTGSDQSGLDNIMYLLRTGAMVELSKEQQAEYPELLELLERLAALDFKIIDKAGYQEACRMITYVSEKLFLISEEYQRLEELVNDLYILNLTRKDAVKDCQEEASALTILAELAATAAESGISDEITAQLYQLEGIQEQYYEKYLRLEGAPEYQDGEAKEASQSRIVERLMSSSSFAELENIRAGSAEGSVSREAVEQAAMEFFQQLDELFAKVQKPVVRAVMAATLANLPICFSSLEEIQSYISNSLASCTDSAEKETCMELLQQLME